MRGATFVLSIVIMGARERAASVALDQEGDQDHHDERGFEALP